MEMKQHSTYWEGKKIGSHKGWLSGVTAATQTQMPGSIAPQLASVKLQQDYCGCFAAVIQHRRSSKQHLNISKYQRTAPHPSFSFDEPTHILHRQCPTLPSFCLSINTFMSYDTFLRTRANTCLSSINRSYCKEKPIAKQQAEQIAGLVRNVIMRTCFPRLSASVFYTMNWVLGIKSEIWARQ